MNAVSGLNSSSELMNVSNLRRTASGNRMVDSSAGGLIVGMTKNGETDLDMLWRLLSVDYLRKRSVLWEEFIPMNNQYSMAM